MSRETYELSAKAWRDTEWPRGPGDPEFYGYPNEPIKETTDVTTSPADVPF